ncbi:F-box only protein 9-like protein, partial [Dinothrombium tinctorium]
KQDDQHDEPSLSSLFESNNSNNIEKTLTDFRNTWKQELSQKQSALHNETSVSIEVKAKYWFERGINLEKAGKHYDAVACYRKATQLIPDIEFKYYNVEQEPELQINVNSAIEENNNRKLSSHLSNDNEDLRLKFQELNLDKEGNFYICEPDTYSDQTHISHLPIELIHYICRWIVTNELDYRSLEQLSAVCRGFYVICRDADIWKRGCIKVWGRSRLESVLAKEYCGSWRRMFIERTRVNYNGAYISRTTYIRQGENSFQDIDYKPCYLVEYYRYLRFFPDGTILMLNTPDNPYQSLPKLKWKNASPPVLVGNYRLSGTSISAVLKRMQRSGESASSRYKRSHLKNFQTSEQEFHILLEIKNVKGRRNFQLFWKGYSAIYRRNNKQEAVTTFDLSLNKFPPLIFSRVKSYTLNAQKPI